MAAERTRILVVEEHGVIRKGLVMLLDLMDGLQVVGEAADGLEAVERFHERNPDITLIDLHLAQLSGVEVIRRLRLESPAARFIALTTFDGDDEIPHAMEIGAQGHLLNGMAADELVAAIRRVCASSSACLPSRARTARVKSDQI